MEASPLTEDEAVLLEQGRQDFDNGRFWHAHEAWEDLWNSLKARHAPLPEILLIQGLIQTAALLYNHQRRKERGVANQWAKLTPKLEPWGVAWGFDIAQHVKNISAFYRDAGEWQQTYENVRLPTIDEVGR